MMIILKYMYALQFYEQKLKTILCNNYPLPTELKSR